MAILKKILISIGIVVLFLIAWMGVSSGIQATIYHFQTKDNQYYDALEGCSAERVKELSLKKYASSGSNNNNDNQDMVYSDIIDLTGTIWVLNSILDDRSFFYNITFISNGNIYDSSTRTYVPRLQQDWLKYGNVLVYNNNTWESETYRTISITGGTDATDASFISWLSDNAILSGSVTTQFDITINGTIIGSYDENTSLLVNSTGLYNSDTYTQIYTYSNQYYTFGGFTSTQGSLSLDYPINSTITLTADISLWVVPLELISNQLYIDGNYIGTYSNGDILTVVGSDQTALYGVRAGLISGFDNYVYTWGGTDDWYLVGFYDDNNSLISYISGYEIEFDGSNIYLYTRVIKSTYSLGYRSGYDSGLNFGYNSGYDIGYQEGLNNNDAYEQGKQDGLNDNASAKISNAWTIIVSTVNGFFNLEILPGFKLSYLVYLGVGAIVIAIAIKLWVH